MKLRKTQVAAAVGAALFVAGTAVQAQTAPTVQVYGQVTRALLFADDGTQSKWFHVDNEASGTRFGMLIVAAAVSAEEIPRMIAPARRGDAAMSIGNILGTILFFVLFILILFILILLYFFEK